MPQIMNQDNQSIPNAPIIEAIVDIVCDLPINLDMQNLRENAETMLHKNYPKFRQQFIQHHEITRNDHETPELKVNQLFGAMQFLAEDEKQLIQFRHNGFSFNRLAPYVSFDTYLEEIQWAWRIYLKLTQPLIVRKIGIRMINRIMLPLDSGKLNFDDYLQVGPRLPETSSPLNFLGFLDQQMTVDSSTGNQAHVLKTTELPQGDKLPLIVDIDVFRPCEITPFNWPMIQNHLVSLRSLKNEIFRNTLTPRCLSLFSQEV